MNDLERIGTTDAGNALFMFPLNGHLFYWERIDYSTLRLHTVDVLESTERQYDEWCNYENLPAPVRGAISRSNYRMRSTKTTLVGAMSDD